MNRIKKLMIQFLCTVLMSAVLMPVSYAENNNAAQKASLLRRLEVISADMVQADDSPVTKALFAYQITGLLGMNELVDVQDGKLRPSGLVDLVENNAETRAVKYLETLGVVSGDGKGRFYPDAEITYEDAVTILIRALGYSKLADTMGGYSSGYLNVAGQMGLTKGIGLSVSKTMTKKDVVNLLYNTLEADLAEISVVTENGVKLKRDAGNVLNGILKTYRVRGIVTATEVTGIDAYEECGKNQIRVDDVVYEIGEDLRYAMDYLGYYVELYYKEIDGEYRIISVDEIKNEVLTVSADEIEDAEYDSIMYSEEGSSKEKKAKFSGAAVVYNGKKYSDYTQEDLLIESGNITLINNDSDSDYDVVFIDSYVNYVISDINVNEEIIYTKSGEKIDLEMNDGQLVNIGGAEISISELKKDRILSVMESKDQELSVIYYCDSELSGIVESVENEEGISYIQIEGERYKLAKYLNQNIKFNDSGKFYLDIEGKIGNFIFEKTSSVMFGYLMRGYLDEADESFCFQILTADGEKSIYKTYKNFKLNNGKVSPEQIKEMSELFSEDGKIKRQLIQFRANSKGEITKMVTALGSEPETYDALYKVSMENTETTAKYNASVKSFRYYTYLDNDTIIFQVPRQDVEIPFNEDDYEVKTASVFGNGVNYNILAYNTTRDQIYADAVVNHVNKLGGDEVHKSISFTLVDGITEAYDEDTDEITYQLKGLRDNKEIEVCFESKDVLEQVLVYGNKAGTPYQIERGDIIRFSTNENGKINSLELIYDASKRQYFGSANPEVQSNGFAGEVSTYHLLALKKIDGYVDVESIDSRSNTAVRFYRLPLEKFAISVYDEKEKEIRTGTVSDLKAANVFGRDNASYIVCLTRAAGNPSSAVIYNFQGE